VVNFYRRYIAEGKAIAFFSIFVTALLRGWIFSDVHQVQYSVSETRGYLWDQLFPLLGIDPAALPIYNYMVAFLLSCLLAYASWHYALIRDKTFLPFAMSLMIFSCHPQLVMFSPASLSCLLFFFAACIMFGIYQHPSPQWKLFNISCILAFSSLIAIGVLPFVFFILLGLVFFRIFSLRSVLSIFFGLAFVYWICFIASLMIGQLPLFAAYFLQLQNITFLHISDFSPLEWCMFGLYILLYTSILISYRINMHKDSIRIRSQIMFLMSISLILFLSYCLMSWDLQLTLYLIAGTFVLPLSHFFVLTHSKVKIVLFYVLVLAYMGFCFLYNYVS
jgi:hypothetical protein